MGWDEGFTAAGRLATARWERGYVVMAGGGKFCKAFRPPMGAVLVWMSQRVEGGRVIVAAIQTEGGLGRCFVASKTASL